MVSTYVFIIVVLIIMSAYFSATETAFSSLNKTRLKTLAEKGNRKALLVCELSDQYDKLISTILIGNNIVNIATASIGTVLFVKLYGDIGATISTVVITLLVLIFSEISPKSIAKDCPEQFAMFSAPIINGFIWLFTPLNIVFSLWKKQLTKLLQLKTNTKMSQEELLMLVTEVQQDGSIDKNEGELLRNAIEFADQEAEDILTHRVDLEAIPLDADKEEIARIFTESGFSRLLVYSGNIDNIMGVLHQKDFYLGGKITKIDVKTLLTPVIFVLKNEKIGVLLRKLQKVKSHMAVVLDEYGGTYGIVTMEDILEELVGEIWDEHDEIAENIKKIDDNAYRVEGCIALDDFCDFFYIKSDSEMSSFGGWIVEQLGRIPTVGDSFEYMGWTISVTAVQYHRVMEAAVSRKANILEQAGANDNAHAGSI